MAYSIKITGLTNKNELVTQQSTAAHRLYKFSLNEAPDGFWVLLLQQASERAEDITLSANAGSKELWVSAQSALDVQTVLQRAKRAVGQANADANDATARTQPTPAAQAAAAAAPDALAAEIDALSFDDDEDVDNLAVNNPAGPPDPTI